MTMVVVLNHHQDFASSTSPADVTKPCRDALEKMVVTDLDDGTHITECDVTDTNDLSSHQSSSSSSLDEEHEEEAANHCDGPSMDQLEAPQSPEERFPSTPQYQQRSILKHRASDSLYIKDSRGSWKCLPKPDMEHIHRLSASKVQDSREDGHGERPAHEEGRRHSVTFGSILIRSYAQTLGDNPSVSYGPPIGLDWDYEEHEALTLDEYEDNRRPRRSIRQMVLSYYHRKNLLMWVCGLTEAQVSALKKQIGRQKLQRNLTKTLLPMMPVEAALESAARKAKRAFSGKTKSPPS